MSKFPSNFDLLSNELILHIALFLTLSNIMSLYLSNSRFNKVILGDE
jgi:hypothetical protein